MSGFDMTLTFCFEVLTDLAFIPPLLIMWRWRRHFELFIGTSQLATAFLYNWCNALNTTAFLNELQWHGLNNILTTTYVLLLLIHLQANASPTVDIVLRYAAFSLCWVAQIKDGYWTPFYTLLVVLIFCLMPVCKFGCAGQLPPYDFAQLWKGLLAGAAAGFWFMLGLDDTTDPYRLFYGLSQICVGLALFHLWQLVPLEVQKAKGDSDVSTVITPLNTPCDSRGHSRTPSGTSLSGIVSGMGQRAISIQDLACHSRLEYY